MKHYLGEFAKSNICSPSYCGYFTDKDFVEGDSEGSGGDQDSGSEFEDDSDIPEPTKPKTGGKRKAPVSHRF